MSPTIHAAKATIKPTPTLSQVTLQGYFGTKFYTFDVTPTANLNSEGWLLTNSANIKATLAQINALRVLGVGKTVTIRWNGTGSFMSNIHFIYPAL